MIDPICPYGHPERGLTCGPECIRNIENDELRLKLDESVKKVLNDIYDKADEIILRQEGLITVIASKKEWQALLKMIENEFIPHDIYNEIHSLLKKINEQLAG